MANPKSEILQQLKRDILTLVLKPGSILSETALSERFEISRTPLRDVLKQLELENYIDVYPKKGNLVSYIDLDSVEQIIYLRSTLEKELIKDLALQMPLKGTLELNRIVALQEQVMDRDDAHEAFLELDDAFHHTLFTLTGREFLWNLIQQCNVHYIRYRRLHLLKRDKLEALLQEHRRLLDCIEHRDLDSVDRLVMQHLRGDIHAKYLQENFAEYIQS
ncbi:GntR family transcriptional regulator [Paenibacillus chibensis]|uniref:GntR family transcriptional regulator n=1 Tax=Paenibacillus chibensis TaxID=59846 RepID=UPI000FD897DA|nr:GntR family transcriptional regulator [Paenibacillus chibensis]MEC0369642.1 GntR family transcriptional regulator [Paenibacillus chibensis]